MGIHVGLEPKKLKNEFWVPMNVSYSKYFIFFPYNCISHFYVELNNHGWN